MNRINIGILTLLVFFTLMCGQNLASEVEPQTQPGVQEKETIARAKVLSVTEGEELNPSIEGWVQGKEQLVTVRILSGSLKGQEVKLSHLIPDQPGLAVIVKPGDEVIISMFTEGNQIREAFIFDYARDKKLYYLAGFFVLIMIIIGGLKGLKSVIALALTGAGIFFVLLPLIFKGYNPITATVLVAAILTAITMTLVHGANKKTLAGIIGTTCGVITAGLLAMLVGKAARLTGFSSEEMQMLLYIPQQINFDIQGLLFAGMLIGALGAVMDVAISVASAIAEIVRVNPKLKPKEIFQAGMNVGRDIMGTMANTLILAYTGGALPLLLIFMAYEMPYLKIINLDLIATEIVRALTGSVGLVLAIPISAAVAVFLYTRVNSTNSTEGEE